MSKKVYVTKAQERAAQLIVERSAKSGKAVRSGVSKIADASGRTVSRSTASGRFVRTTAANSKAAGGRALPPSGKKG